VERLKAEDADEETGINIIKKSLKVPLRKIAENAGLEGGVVVENAMSKGHGYGFNAETGKYEDLLEAGVIDPAKVVRTTIQNASSIASLILTTEALVTDIPDEKEKSPGRGAYPPPEY
jgi:chaperonin GroEL